MKNIEYLYIDTETTGLDLNDDELLRVSVISDECDCLFNTYVKPVHKTQWPLAQDLNGISPNMVQNASCKEEVMRQLSEIIRGKHVVAYNMRFDQSFLRGAIENAESLHCCMEAYAEHVGIFDESKNHWHWHSLKVAVNDVNKDFEFSPHDSLDDCRATREVWQWLMNHDKKIEEKYGFSEELKSI